MRLPPAAPGRYALILPAVVVGVGALLIFNFKLAGLVTLILGIGAGAAVMRFATTPARIVLIATALTVALAVVAIALVFYDCARHCT